MGYNSWSDGKPWRNPEDDDDQCELDGVGERADEWKKGAEPGSIKEFDDDQLPDDPDDFE